MKKFLLLSFISIGLQAGINQESIHDYQTDHSQKHILEIARSLPNKGILRKKANGYCYLDISNEYITKIFPNMILDGHLRPTDSFTAEEGAHITVMTELEKCSGVDAEVGNEFNFEIIAIRKVASIKTHSGNGGIFHHHTGDRWFIAVESDELEALRMRNGLSPLVNQHDFHISIGFEVPFDRISNFGTTPK